MEKQEIKNWRVLDSEYISREPWFTVRKERVEVGNGSIIPSYYVLEYPAWICVLAIDKEGNMIMERQYRHGFGRVDYELCAGVMDMPVFSINVGVGRNLIYSGGDMKGFYQILALKTYITRHLFLHVGYQLSKFKDPNNLMLGLGYRFHDKR